MREQHGRQFISNLPHDGREARSTHAGREEDLGAHAVGAVVLEEVGPLLPGRVAGVRVVVVEADEGDGLVGKGRGVVGPPVGVAGEHPEALREGVYLLVLVARPLEIAARTIAKEGSVMQLDDLCSSRR
jgi:hypothetical protein